MVTFFFSSPEEFKVKAMPNCVNTYLETLLTLILDQPWERIFSSHAKSFGLELGPWNAALEGFGRSLGTGKQCSGSLEILAMGKRDWNGVSYLPCMA